MVGAAGFSALASQPAVFTRDPKDDARFGPISSSGRQILLSA
jgi:hypothetical protein